MSGDVQQIIKAGKMSESLFSLEVIVDKLTAPSIVCRFPAVAFRLLDFPTLLIYHVEHDLAETIKSKVRSDSQYRVPPQFPELKDRRQFFNFKKGKSCLFKIPPQTLHAHLMNTPLYMMLIDTYPEVPKLLGNCSIPLDDVMDLIFKDINHLGVSVPSAHGQKGDYKLFNLMGAEISEVTLGFRLLSLGMGLVQHIPDANVSVYTPKTTEDSNKLIVKDEKIQAIDKTTEMILQNIEAADKNVQVAVSDFIPQMEDVDTQTNIELTPSKISHSSMQTEKYIQKKTSKHQKRSHASVHPYTKASNEINDFFVTNMTCPPPLFYNSQADEPVLHEGLTFSDNIFSGVQVPAPNYAWREEDLLHTSSSDDTIRHEDKFSDSDVEIDYDFVESRVVRRESKRALKRKAKSKAMNMTNEDLRQNVGNVMQTMQNQTGLGHPTLQQLPLLNALITEIMTLQGITTGQYQESLQIGAQGKAKQYRAISTPPSSRETKQEREKHLKKLSTPRNVAQNLNDAPSHKVCAAEGRPVPKDKSWVQNNPEFSKPIKKTALSYGITKAQRLRLEKTNPTLLKKLEAEQEERMNSCREKTRAKYMQYQRENEIGTRLMNSARSSVGKRTPRVQEQIRLESSMQSTGDPLSEIPKHHRRPVPTPRKSLSLHNGQIKDALRALAGRELGTPQEWTSGKNDEILQSRTISDDEETQPSQRSVEIHLPKMIQNANETLDGESTLGSIQSYHDVAKPTMSIMPGFGGTQILRREDFPQEDTSKNKAWDSRPESRLTDYGNYSDNFEEPSVGFNETNGYFSGGEPSLRKVVEQYSDGHSLSQRTDLSGEEPSLRKIVDYYSDDSTDIDNDEYVSVMSQKSVDSDRPRSVEHDMAGPRLKIPPSMPSPMASVHSPITAMRPVIPPTREGIAALSTPTDTDKISNESTAYIRESQIPTMSETGLSEDMSEGRKESLPAVQRPKPSPRRRLDRVSSIHTESVSSYAPSDEDNYSETFDDESDNSGPAPVSVVKQMSDLKLAPEAKMGYTWGYSKK